MPSHSSSHPHARHASPSTSSSVKPTGWIRSSSATAGSATKLRVGVLSDRTNLPVPRAIRRSGRCKSRQPRRWWHRDSQVRRARPHRQTAQNSRLCLDFLRQILPPPAIKEHHTRANILAEFGSAAPKLLGHQGCRQPPCGYHHPSLEARTTTLSTTLSTTTIWKHARPVCFAVASAASLAPSAPARLRHPQRPCRHPHHRPMSLHGRHASKHGLESSTYVRQDQCFRPLSREPRRANVRSQTRRRLRFSPHSWPSRSPTLRPPHGPKSIDRKLALFQRMAGIQDDVVREQERRQMENELDRAHQRMQGSSPAAAKSKRPPTSRQRTSLAKQSEAAPTGARVDEEDLCARDAACAREACGLTTCIEGGQECVRGGPESAAVRAYRSVRGRVSRCDAGRVGKRCPLAWPAVCDDETQPLAWDDADEEAAQIPTEAVQLSNPIGSAGEVPTSDDDDFLTEPGVALDAAHDSTPVSKRRRVDTQRMAMPSPVSLTSASGAGRFDSVVAALRRQERRQNSGMQLSLDRYVTKPTCKLDSDDDLDVLSDDEVGDETQPLEWTTPVKRPTLQLASSPAAATQLSTSSGASASASEISLPSQTALDDADTQTRTFFERL
ncbi:hypothetical protein L1887_51436 [Cichorium endivia]|nr:hypothetical protein L1887_51436 [Cichorium endivia]